MQRAHFRLRRQGVRMGSGGPGPGPTPARRTRNASTLHATTFPSPVHARRLLICASTAFGLVMRVATTATGTPFVTGEDAIACRLGCRACKTHRLASLANLAPVRPVPLTVQAISRGSKFTNPFVFDKGLGCDGKIGAGSYACTSCPSGKFSAAGASECTGCEAGKYMPNQGATSSSTCVSCTAGSYSSAGASTCASCTAGQCGPCFQCWCC